MAELKNISFLSVFSIFILVPILLIILAQMVYKIKKYFSCLYTIKQVSKLERGYRKREAPIDILKMELAKRVFQKKLNVTDWLKQRIIVYSAIVALIIPTMFLFIFQLVSVINSHNNALYEFQTYKSQTAPVVIDYCKIKNIDPSIFKTPALNYHDK